MCQGKLVDDLSPAQFDSLVRVLSFLSSEMDFRHLLTPSNLQEVFNHPKEFILPKVQLLNFEGSGEARARERVLSHFITRIKKAFEEMARGDVVRRFRSSLLPFASHSLD